MQLFPTSVSGFSFHKLICSHAHTTRATDARFLVAVFIACKYRAAIVRNEAYTYAID